MSDAPPSFRDPKILLPFIAVTLIWGSTWIVIKDQLSIVPPSWSVSYRFLLAGVVMLIVAAVTRVPLKLGREGQIFALLLGIAQFVLNFNFVYRAEIYVTSGLVALVFALLFVPNALFSRIFLGTKTSMRFIVGSAIAVAGIGLLFVNEVQGDDAAIRATLIGIGFTLLGVTSASIANVMQATERARNLPMASMLGWSMLWGGSIDALFSWATVGPPVVEWRLGYLGGVGFLSVFASALAFSLYFRSIRDLGAAKAAYSSVVIPVLAMAYSTVLEGYRWTPLAVLGSVVALSGMVVALSSRKPAQ